MALSLSGPHGSMAVGVRFADSPDVAPETQAHLQSDAAVLRPAALFDQLISASSSLPVPRQSQQASEGNAQAHRERTFVAIESLHKGAPRKGQSQFPFLIVPVTREPAEQADSKGPNGFVDDADEPVIILPRLYRKRFFPDDKEPLDPSSLFVTIHPHTPIVLSHLVLSAHGEAAFEFAQTSQDQIEEDLSGRLIRQLDSVSFGPHTFTVALSEPVLQGLSSQDSTEIYVTCDEESDARTEQTGYLANGHAELVDQHGSRHEDEAGDRSHIIVDEHFFTKGVLDSLESNVDQTAGSSFFADAYGTNFTPKPVQNSQLLRDALQSWARQAWQDEHDFDLESCIVLDESVFPHIGAFDGDWALAEVEGQGKVRAVKMLCAPWGYQTQDDFDAADSLPAVYLSPLLLQNLYALEQFDPIVARSKPITLRSLGSWQSGGKIGQNRPKEALPDCPLPLPFADSLTISRVASSLSVNRTYQTLFLGALRNYFEMSRRIVQQGDIFAVSFDKSKTQWAVESVGEEDAQAASSAPANTLDDAYSITLPSTNGPTAQENATSTAVVHFCVTDVSPELCEPVKVNEQASQADLWIHEMARTGQFGSVVDTSLTKMVQAGVTKTRVIDTSQWLNVASETPLLPVTRTPLTAPESVYGKLLKLVQATLMNEAAQFDLHLSVLLKGARGSGKRTIIRWVAQKTGVHLVELNCFDLISDTDARTEGVLRARIEQAASCAPSIVVLYHIEALARKSQALETGQEPTIANVLQDCLSALRQKPADATQPISPQPVVVIGTAADADRCPLGVLACFRHELAIEAPNEAERLAILETCLADSSMSVDVNLKALATQTAALVASDLVDLVGRAKLASVERVCKLREDTAKSNDAGSFDVNVVEAGVTLTGSDFEVALNKARLSYSENIGAPKIPNVTWDDVGGLISVKDDILDTIQLPLEHPELFSDGLKKRSGILLYGPPGTGKTLLAKAVATSCSLNFFSVKGPELLNMYIGESEANVRRVFQRARDAKPCVIFFDELDSIAPKRGNQGDSGGVMDRIVSQLLAELDGMSSGDSAADVFVIGATNRPDLLDPALLRPGRFDRMLYLAVSQTHAEQLNILQALTRKFKLDKDVGDLTVVAEQCPMNLTGADFYALCSDAMLKSMTRKAATIDEQVARTNEEFSRARAQGQEVLHPLPITSQYYLEELADASDLDVQVSRADFEAALQELVPSVSAQEMEHYRSVQQKFSSTDPKEENAQEAGEPSGQGAVLHPSLERPRQGDERTIAEVMAALQSLQTNGQGDRNAEVQADEEKPKVNKGKGKARAIDE